jgi:hypothetical protein
VEAGYGHAMAAHEMVTVVALHFYGITLPSHPLDDGKRRSSLPIGHHFWVIVTVLLSCTLLVLSWRVWSLQKQLVASNYNPDDAVSSPHTRENVESAYTHF